MSSSNGDGLPLRAALKVKKLRARLISRAAEASATATRDEVERPDDDEREEEANGDPT
jgi:hypothetical protein